MDSVTVAQVVANILRQVAVPEMIASQRFYVLALLAIIPVAASPGIEVSKSRADTRSHSSSLL